MDVQTTRRVLSYLTNAITDELEVDDDLVLARCHILHATNPHLLGMGVRYERVDLHGDDQLLFDQVANFMENTAHDPDQDFSVELPRDLRDILIRMLPECSTEGGLYSMIYREINIYEQIVQHRIRFRDRLTGLVNTFTIRELIANNADKLATELYTTAYPNVLHIYYELLNIIQDIDFDRIRTGILDARQTGRELNRTVEFE